MNYLHKLFLVHGDLKGVRSRAFSLDMPHVLLKPG